MALSDTERQQISRMGGYARSARASSGAAVTEAARSAFWNSFYEKTDPALPEAERVRQANAARKLHMTGLSRKAAAARRKAAEAAAEAREATEAEIAALRGDIAI
jgi:hypothetical protein